MTPTVDHSLRGFAKERVVLHDSRKEAFLDFISVILFHNIFVVHNKLR